MLQLQGSDVLLMALILVILQVDSAEAGTELSNPANSSISPCTPFTDGMENVTDVTKEYTLDYNGFEEQCVKQDVRVFRERFLPTMYFIIFFIGLAGNGLVMLRYLYFKRLKTGTDYYMLNLAIADIVFLLTLPFWAVSISYSWVFGKEMCKVIYCLSKMSFISGMFLLMSVSIERYFAIVQAPSAHRLRARTVLISKLSSVCIWILAFILSIPELINSGILMQEKYVCTIFSKDLQSLEAKLKIIQMVLGFLLPFIIMSLCYSMIIRTLLRARNFEKYKAIKVIITIVIAFVVFQLPYNSVTLLRTLHYNTTVCTKIKTLDMADDVTYSLACLRCCLNPFLYAIIGVKFRNDMCTFLKDLGCLSNAKFVQWATAKPSKRSSFAMDTETTTTFSP